MRRRTLIALTPGLLAGCISSDYRQSGPRDAPRSPEGTPPSGDGSAGGGNAGGGGSGGLEVVTFDVQEGDDGKLVVPVTLRNTASSERSGVVVVEADVDDETYEGRREVTLDGDAETSLSFTLDVSYEAFVGGGDISVDIET